MKNSYRMIIAICAVILLVIVVGVFAANQPLSKNLSITPAATSEPIQVPQIQSSPEIFPTQSQIAEQPPLKASTSPTQAAVSVPESTSCGVTGSTTIFVLGEGHQESEEEEGVGAVRLVKVDFNQKKVTVLGIPSHMVIRVIDKKAITLASVYYHAKQDASGTDKTRMLEATKALAQAFADHFGYAPEHYLTINERVFSNVVDALGGVNVIVPVDVDGTSDNNGYFKAGEHVFSGKMALDYVSILNSRSVETKLEVGRNQRQNDVLKGILTEAQKPENWAKVPLLIEQFYVNSVTDFSVKQVLDYVCLYRDPAFHLEYISIPPATIMRAADQPLLPIDPLLGDFIKETMQ